MENQKSDLLAPAQYQKAIRERLNTLRKQHPQSELARRTNTPLTNVHRVLRTGKIPAEFCAALVTAFAVNPAWLLMGEGGALLSDVTAQSAQTGQGLLALVESMNAVSRLRLGALAGKQHQKTLRELHDAFSTYERLREKLNAQSKPAFAGLLDEMARGISQMNIEAAQNACAAAREVSRLCDDEALHLRLNGLQSDLEYARGSLEKSLEFSRRVFSQLLRAGALESEGDLRNVVNLVMTLKDSGRHREALRTAIAALALAQDHGKDWTAYSDLELFRGHLEVELGMAHKGLARIQRIWPTLDKSIAESATMATVIYERALLLCGLISPREARQLGTRGYGSARQLLRWACWQEDVAALREACTVHIGNARDQLRATDYDCMRAKLLLRALDGKARFIDFENGCKESPPAAASSWIRDLVLTAHQAQFARAARDYAKSAALSQKFEELCANLPPEFYLNLDLRSLHYRNVLALENKASKFATLARLEQAREFFAANLRNGYGCYAALSRVQSPKGTVPVVG
jgi:tetratricopeptide (TPR) repeat protein